MKSTKPAAKLFLTDGNDALGRFSTMYQEGSSGKGTLLSESVAGGFILKETGLLDIIKELDDSSVFRNATRTEKRSMLLSMLSNTFTGMNAAPVSIPALEQPEIVPHSIPEPKPEPEPVKAPEPEPEPPKVKPALPDL